MGKNKYRAVRKSNRNSLFQNKRLANYLPYVELAKYISSLDIGVLEIIPPGLFRDI